MKEHEIQDQIRKALTPDIGAFWRANAGQGWVGHVVGRENGLLVLKNPRPFIGLPEGFPDLFGVRPTVVTPDMIGQKLGVFVGLEIKQPGERPKPHQAVFMEKLRQRGCRAGIARSVEDALRVVEGERI